MTNAPLFFSFLFLLILHSSPPHPPSGFLVLHKKQSLTCSLVSMLSIRSTLPNRSDEKWERYERWIMSVTCISICLSFIGGLCSLMPPEKALKLENPVVSKCKPHQHHDLQQTAKTAIR